MSKEIKQKADELVGMFRPLVSGVTTKNGVLENLEEERTIKTVAVAILHQKRLIDELEGLFIDNNIDVMNEAEIRIYKKRQEQKAILTELESRL